MAAFSLPDTISAPRGSQRLTLSNGPATWLSKLSEPGRPRGLATPTTPLIAMSGSRPTSAG